MRRSVFGVFFVAAALLADQASAETRLFVLVQGRPYAGRCSPTPCPAQRGVLWEIDVEAAQIVASTPIPADLGGYANLAVTADARYVVWSGAEWTGSGVPPSLIDSIAVYDRSARTSSVLMRPDSSFDGAPIGSTLIAHPSDLSVFGRLRTKPVFRLWPTATLGFETGTTYQYLEDVSRDGQRVLIGHSNGAVLLNATTGAEIRRFDGPYGEWAMSADGSAVYVAAGAGGGTLQISKFDAATGALLTSTTTAWPSAVAADLRVDPRAGRLFVSANGGALGKNIEVRHPDTLAVLGTIASPLTIAPSGTPPSGPFYSHRLVFDRDRSTAYLLTNADRSEQNWSRIDIIDTNALTIIGGADLPTSNRAADIAIVPRAAQAMGLTAHVDGSTVSLDWSTSAVGMATGFRLEAGSAPGAANIAMFELGLVSELVVTGVPPGRYYVRVRSLNFAGPGDSSTEIVVDVP